MFIYSSLSKSIWCLSPHSEDENSKVKGLISKYPKIQFLSLDRVLWSRAAVVGLGVNVHKGSVLCTVLCTLLFPPDGNPGDHLKSGHKEIPYSFLHLQSVPLCAHTFYLIVCLQADA